MKLKNKILTFGKRDEKGDYDWHTYKEGQHVPEHLVELAKKFGGEFEKPVEEKVVKKEAPVKKEGVVKKALNKVLKK